MVAGPPDAQTRLLIVDPNRTYRDLLYRLLITDHAVTIAADAAEALRLAETEAFGLAFIDASVVPMEAPRLATRLAERSPGLVSVLAVASDERLEDHPWYDRFDMILPKPFELSELEEIVSRGLELHDERRVAAAQAA